MNLQIVLVGSDSWATSIRRCWRFARFKLGRKKHGKAFTIELNLKRSICFGALMGFVLYFGGALALYLMRAQMPHNEITYVDIILAPVNLEPMVRKQGVMQIRQARDDLKNENYKEAFFKLRSGVRRVPEDQEARLELAKFYIAWGMDVRATDLLMEGLQYGFPQNPLYLKTFVLLCRKTDNNPALMQAIPIILDYPEVAENKKARVSMTSLLLRAQIRAGDYAGVVQTADVLNREDTGRIYHDNALFAFLRMGAYEDALINYDTLPPEVIEQPRIILLQGYLKQQLDDEAGAREIFFNLFRDHPTAWREHMDAVLMLHNHGDKRAANSLLDLFLAMHRRNGSALTAISEVFTDLPDSEKVLRVLNNVRFDAPELFGALYFFYVQALVTEGKFDKAKAELEPLKPAAPKDPGSAAVFEAYNRIITAATASSEGEYNSLVTFAESNRLDEELYWEAAEAMRKVGAYETSEFILNAGLSEYPFSRLLSKLRNHVLKEQGQAEQQTGRVVASVKDGGYQEQRIGRDPIEKRLLSEDVAQDDGLEGIIGDENLKKVDITEDEINRDEY